MALATYAAYKAAMPHAVISLPKSNHATVAGRIYSSWQYGPFSGSAPTSPVAPDSSMVGAISRNQLPTGIATWVKSVKHSGFSGALVTLFDRLSHQGGLSGSVTTAQTTNLPTAALTRHTSGDGVMAFIEVYSIIGATATTATVSYTNSNGTSGRTSPAFPIGGSAERGAGIMIPIPLQAGDEGVRSVESITLAATTALAGNFGITLVKPLLAIPAWLESMDFQYDTVLHMGAVFAPIAADACLMSGVSCFDTNTFHKVGALELIKQV